MTHLTGKERAEYVQQMFTRIAHRYDLMNRLMTAGQDVEWRKAVIRQARLKPNFRLLDLGAGTGDLALGSLCVIDTKARASPATGDKYSCCRLHTRNDASWEQKREPALVCGRRAEPPFWG